MSVPPRARRAIRAALVIAVMAGLWFATAGRPATVRVWTVSIAVLLPLFAMKQVAAVGDPAELPRIPAYISSIISLWLLAGLTAVVARMGSLGAGDLQLTPIPWAALVAWSAVPTAASVAVLLLARRLGVRESALLRRLLPETRSEKHIFAGLSVTAGFCEELVFRGFLLHILLPPFGTAGAVAISSVAFGLAHAYQDARGAARASLLGVILALPPVLAGSLWPSIIAHTAVDLIGGIFLRDRIAGDVA